MSESWIEIARRLQQRPWNRSGTDKTWVLRAMWEHQQFQAEIGRAERVGRS